MDGIEGRLRDILAHAPGDVGALDALGRHLNDAKRHAEAIACFEHALAIDPGSTPIAAHRDDAIADAAQWLLVENYRRTTGRAPRLSPPRGFNERILHRILFDRDPRLKIVCDKLAVREFIAGRVGADLMVPLLGVWERAADIPWLGLPKHFVLKPSHASGAIAMIEQGVRLDTRRVAEAADGWVAIDYFDQSLEWAYRGLPRRILAEPLLLDPAGGPALEIYVWTFGGRAKVMRTISGAKAGGSRRGGFFDAEGRPIAIQAGIPYGDAPLPRGLRPTLIRLAEQVAADFSSMRVDFYVLGKDLKIGELTPYTRAGAMQWNPPEHDDLMGRLWEPDFPLSDLPTDPRRARSPI